MNNLINTLIIPFQKIAREERQKKKLFANLLKKLPHMKNNEGIKNEIIRLMEYEPENFQKILIFTIKKDNQEIFDFILNNIYFSKLGLNDSIMATIDYLRPNMFERLLKSQFVYFDFGGRVVSDQKLRKKILLIERDDFKEQFINVMDQYARPMGKIGFK